MLDRDEDSLRVEVEDDGVGIPGDFDWEDSGLGLQIVRRLVADELGGKISLQREGGTRVEIEIPLPGYASR
jgi:two-component sensor histidine kinase